MTCRMIKGTIHLANEQPWQYARLIFCLQTGSFNSRSQVQYPENKILAWTNEEGKFCVDLWTNTEGQTPTQYLCTLPDGKTFSFVLTPGKTAIDLADLRAATQEKTEWRSQTETIRDYIEKLTTEEVEILAIAPNQTTFALAKTPVAPHLSRFYVNGVKAIYSRDYIIDGSLLRVTEAFDTDWILEVFYR